MIYAQKFQIAVMDDESTKMTHSTLSFDTDDPYAISMIIEGNDPWVFGRDLFVKGGGEGDVRVYFNEEYYVVFLYTICGIVFRKDHVDKFLTGTLTLVPKGSEFLRVKWDDEMKNILG